MRGIGVFMGDLGSFGRFGGIWAFIEHFGVVQRHFGVI